MAASEYHDGEVIEIFRFFFTFASHTEYVKRESTVCSTRASFRFFENY